MEVRWIRRLVPPQGDAESPRGMRKMWLSKEKSVASSLSRHGVLESCRPGIQTRQPSSKSLPMFNRPLAEDEVAGFCFLSLL